MFSTMSSKPLVPLTPYRHQDAPSLSGRPITSSLVSDDLIVLVVALIINFSDLSDHSQSLRSVQIGDFSTLPRRSRTYLGAFPSRWAVGAISKDGRSRF